MKKNISLIKFIERTGYDKWKRWNLNQKTYFAYFVICVYLEYCQDKQMKFEYFSKKYGNDWRGMIEYFFKSDFKDFK